MSSKNKILNIILKNGGKSTSEKIFKNSLKLAQRKTKKNFRHIMKNFLINTTVIFKNTEQKMKRGKRKTSKIIPEFVHKPNLRLTASLKLVKSTLAQTKTIKAESFYRKLAHEIISAHVNEGAAVVKKNNYHIQSLSVKRHLTNFRW